MVKRPRTLSLDNDNFEELKRRGVNISERVDEYLAALVRIPVGSKLTPGSRGPRSARIERMLERELKLEQRAKAQAKFEAALKPYREYFKRKSSPGPHDPKWGHDARMRWLKATADNLGLKVPKLLKLLEPGAQKRRR